MSKQKIINLLSEATRLKKEEVEDLIETPPNSDLGDYAFPLMILTPP